MFDYICTEIQPSQGPINSYFVSMVFCWMTFVVPLNYVWQSSIQKIRCYPKKTEFQELPLPVSRLHPTRVNEQDGASTTCCCDVAAISGKLDKILSSISSIESRLGSLELKLEDIKQQVSSNTSDVTDLKKSVTFVQDKLESTKSQINKKVEFNLGVIRRIEDHIDDINNRNRRNNIVIHGVPEGSEASQTCEEFVHDLLTNHLKLEGAKIA